MKSKFRTAMVVLFSLMALLFFYKGPEVIRKKLVVECRENQKPFLGLMLPEAPDSHFGPR